MKKGAIFLVSLVTLVIGATALLRQREPVKVVVLDWKRVGATCRVRFEVANEDEEDYAVKVHVIAYIRPFHDPANRAKIHVDELVIESPIPANQTRIFEEAVELTKPGTIRTVRIDVEVVGPA